jgi:hypothetical protein
MHTNSELDVLHMHGKRKRYNFQWHWYQVQLKLDSARMVKTSFISRAQHVQELSILKLMSRSHTIQLWSCWTHLKGKDITFLIELFSYPNLSRINGNRRNNWTSKICLGVVPPFWVDGPCIELEYVRDTS